MQQQPSAQQQPSVTPSKPTHRQANWPGQIESVSTSPRKAVLVGFALIAACVAGMGLWGATAPIASAVLADGQVVVASKRRQIQHPTGGVIRAIHVDDGAHVEQGALLVELEDLDAADRHTRTRDAFYLALAGEARLIAETSDHPTPTFSPELLAAAAIEPSVKAIADGQKQFFEVRRVEIFGQLKMLQERREQLAGELKAYQAEQVATKAQIAMTSRELKTVEDLYEQGLTTRTRVFSLRREIAQMTGNAGRLTAQCARIQSAMLESDLKLLQIRNELQTQIQGELRDTQAKLPNLRDQFRAANQAFERMKIRAPVAGTIMASRTNTLGAVVQPGDTVLEIVPANDRLRVEVQLRPIDVDSIHVGLETEIRLTGLSQRDSLPLHGRVTHVSADSMQDRQTNATYFVAHVDLPKSEIARLGAGQMHPGMPASVTIKTGERTALAYLTQPLSDSINRAWRE